MIFRTQKRQGGFTQADNTAIRDKRISLKARGLLWYMLSCFDDKEFNATILQKETGEKRTIIENALKELENFGYLKRIKKRVKGRYKIEFNIYEKPLSLAELFGVNDIKEEDLPFNT